MAYFLKVTKPNNGSRRYLQIYESFYDKGKKTTAHKSYKALGYEGSEELNKNIANSELYLYEDYSHGVYEQAKDFDDRVLSFLKK